MIHSYFVEYRIRCPSMFDGSVNKSVVCFNNIIMPHNLQIFKRAVIKTWEDNHKGMKATDVDIVNLSYLGGR